MDDSIKLINNDSYGAPELKRLYQGFTFKGLIIAITIHVAFIAAYMLIGYINEAKSKDIPVNPNKPIIIVDYKDINEPPPVDETEIPVVKENIAKLKDLSQLEPVPTRREIADDVILKTQDELNNLTDQPVSRDGDSLVAYFDPNNVKIDKDIIDKNIDKDQPPVRDLIYNNYEVEKPPECLNLSQVKSMIIYPELAKEIGQEGKVTVKVLVGKDGNVIQVGSITGPEVFHDEVKGKVKNLQFTPGMQNNLPVKVWVSVPFFFDLK